MNRCLFPWRGHDNKAAGSRPYGSKSAFFNIPDFVASMLRFLVYRLHNVFLIVHLGRSCAGIGAFRNNFRRFLRSEKTVVNNSGKSNASSGLEAGEARAMVSRELGGECSLQHRHGSPAAPDELDLSWSLPYTGGLAPLCTSSVSYEHLANCACRARIEARTSGQRLHQTSSLNAAAKARHRAASEPAYDVALQ